MICSNTSDFQLFSVALSINNIVGMSWWALGLFRLFNVFGALANFYPLKLLLWGI